MKQFIASLNPDPEIGTRNSTKDLGPLGLQKASTGKLFACLRFLQANRAQALSSRFYAPISGSGLDLPESEVLKPCNLEQGSIVRLEGVSKKFVIGNGQVNALKQVMLDVGRGEFISILGPSGSGKSTLLHILGLLSKPSDGEIYFEGSRVSSLAERRLASLRNQHIGFVFQSFHLLNSVSALENVELPLVYQRVSLGHRRRRALEALEIVGMVHRKDHLPRQLSGGESQRVAIARALVVNPSLILADEPTGNLDTQTGLEILRILKALNANGVTLIVVTHDASIAEEAQRRIFLQDGQVVRS